MCTHLYPTLYSSTSTYQINIKSQVFIFKQHYGGRNNFIFLEFRPKTKCMFGVFR